MGNLVPASQWDDVPYFEANAVLTGGPDCPDNIPIQALLNRTEYLKGSPSLGAPTVQTAAPGDNSKNVANTEYVVAHQGAHAAATDPHPQYLKKAGDTMTGPLLIKQGLPGDGGLSFAEPANDTGMFSTADGSLKLYSNGQPAIEISPNADMLFKVGGAEVFRLAARGAFMRNDRVQLPNGLILQFVDLSMAAGVAAGQTQTLEFNWPVVFPNAALHAICGTTGGLSGAYMNVSVENIKKTGGVLYRVSGQTSVLSYFSVFAIGY